MLSWLNQNSGALNVLTSIGLLSVWVLYAHLLLEAYRRERRPRVLINHVKGHDVDSSLMVTNMSERGIHVQMLAAVLDTEDERISRAITDVEIGGDTGAAGETHRVSSQGTLSAGGYMELGSFRDLIHWLESLATRDRWFALEVRIVFLYGSIDQPIGVQRRFEARGGDGEAGMVMVPTTAQSRHLTSGKDRKEVQAWLQQHSVRGRVQAQSHSTSSR